MKSANGGRQATKPGCPGPVVLYREVLINEIDEVSYPESHIYTDLPPIVRWLFGLLGAVSAAIMMLSGMTLALWLLAVSIILPLFLTFWHRTRPGAHLFGGPAVGLAIAFCIRCIQDELNVVTCLVLASALLCAAVSVVCVRGKRNAQTQYHALSALRNRGVATTGIITHTKTYYRLKGGKSSHIRAKYHAAGCWFEVAIWIPGYGPPFVPRHNDPIRVWYLPEQPETTLLAYNRYWANHPQRERELTAIGAYR